MTHVLTGAQEVNSAAPSQPIIRDITYSDLREALRLGWDDFTSMPSRLSAEPLAQEERDRLLARVGSHGYIDDYSGIRISSKIIGFHG